MPPIVVPWIPARVRDVIPVTAVKIERSVRFLLPVLLDARMQPDASGVVQVTTERRTSWYAYHHRSHCLVPKGPTLTRFWNDVPAVLPEDPNPTATAMHVLWDLLPQTHVCWFEDIKRLLVLCKGQTVPEPGVDTWRAATGLSRHRYSKAVDRAMYHGLLSVYPRGGRHTLQLTQSGHQLNWQAHHNWCHVCRERDNKR